MTSGIPTKTLSLVSVIGVILLILGLIFHSSLLSSIAVAFVSIIVIALVVSVLLPFLPQKTSLYPPPETIWSRGNYGLADHIGDNSKNYIEAKTESHITSLVNLRGKRGIIWLRNGSSPHNDIDIFVRDALEHLSGKTVLVTTDGDLSTADIKINTISRILNNENITAWYAQNMEIDNYNPLNNQYKLRAFPIGLDLHSIKGVEPDDMWTIYKNVKSEHFMKWDQRNDVIFSDVHLTSKKYDMRKKWRKKIPYFEKNRLHRLDKRVKREKLWEIYCQTKFVMSLPGNGVDCHRTYEAAYFGAVIVTNESSPLKELWKKMNIPVAYCNDNFSNIIETMDNYKHTEHNLRFFTVQEWRKEMDELLL
jgi:hypothetical protein